MLETVWRCRSRGPLVGALVYIPVVNCIVQDVEALFMSDLDVHVSLMRAKVPTFTFFVIHRGKVTTMQNCAAHRVESVGKASSKHFVGKQAILMQVKMPCKELYRITTHHLSCTIFARDRLSIAFSVTSLIAEVSEQTKNRIPEISHERVTSFQSDSRRTERDIPSSSHSLKSSKEKTISMKFSSRLRGRPLACQLGSPQGCITSTPP